MTRVARTHSSGVAREKRAMMAVDSCKQSGLRPPTTRVALLRPYLSATVRFATAWLAD